MPCGANMSFMPRLIPCSAPYSGGPTTGVRSRVSLTFSSIRS